MSAREWSLIDLFEMGDAASSLLAAHRSGLLAALLAGPGRPGELAASLGLDERATGLVLNVLMAYGAVEVDGDEFRATSELSRIDRDHPGAVGTDLDLFDHVPTFLRTGKPLLKVDGSDRERSRNFVQVAPRLRLVYQAAARELASLLRPELAAGPAVLDVGAGSGVWSLALLDCVPGARLTAIDLPDVAELLREHVATREDRDQVEVIGASYFDVTVRDRSFDVVILGNVLHLEPPAQAQRLVRLAARALRPGGLLAVIESLAHPPYEVERRRALYAMELAMRSASGRTYSAADISRWGRGCGLTDLRQRELPSIPDYVDALTARRMAGKEGGDDDRLSP